MAGTNQIASDTWVPQTDKFGNSVALQPGADVNAFNTRIQDLANRALINNITPEQAKAAGIPMDKNGFYYGQAPGDKAAFSGYTLPNSKDVYNALANWNPSISGISRDQALTMLGINNPTSQGVPSSYTAAPQSVLDAAIKGPAQTANAGQLYAPGSVMGTPQAPLGVVTANGPVNNNRSLISSKPGPGLIKGYDTNDGYKEVYVPAGKYVPGVSLYPKPTNTITPEKLTKETPISLPGATPSGLDQAGSMIAGATTNLAEIIKSLTPPETETEKKQQTLLDQMASLVGENAKRAADQLTAEQSAGLPQLRQQFADINAQILSKSAEYDALVKSQENEPMTMDRIIGSQRAILNAKASEIGLLQARAQGLQGQIETAQNTVNRAIDLKYSSIEAQLGVYQAQLNALQPTLNKEEKIAAQAQQILLDQRKEAIAAQKAEETKVQNLVLQAIESGVTDQKVLSKIAASKSFDEAIKVAGPLIGAKNNEKSAYGSGIVGEYQFYVDQERKAGRTPMSFSDYQNEDANRKRLAASIVDSSGLNPKQTASFLSITTKYQDDALIKAFDKGQGLSAIADQVIKDPNSATNQLKALYGFVKNLDPDSAVREGEIGLANQTTSFLDRFKTSLTRVAEGQVLSPQAAKELALATKELVQGWEMGVKARKSRYISQAQGAGIGDAFSRYLQNSEGGDPLGLGGFGGSENDPLGLGFNSVGGDTNVASLGQLSQKYESSGNPGAIGYDSTGGWSYGIYQLAHNNAQRFIDQSPYAKEFSGISFNSEAFRNKWKEVAQKDPQGFAQAQEQYIAKTHFEPLAVKAAQAGLDLAEHSPVLSEVIFSTGVQHGANTDVINRALAKVGKSASEEELIKAIYNERWNGGRRFANSTPEIKKAVYNRFFGKNGELATALRQLKNYT